MEKNEKGIAGTTPMEKTHNNRLSQTKDFVYVPNDYLKRLKLFTTWGERDGELVVEEDIRLYALRRISEIDPEVYLEWLWFDDTYTLADKIADATNAETMVDFILEHDDLMCIPRRELIGNADTLPEKYAEWCDEADAEMRAWQNRSWKEWFEWRDSQ